MTELSGLARHIELRAVSRWVVLGLLVGLLSGLAACLLYLGYELVKHLVVHVAANASVLEPAGEPALFGWHPAPGSAPRPWVLVIAPAVGGLLSALLVQRLCQEAQGGNEGWLRAFHVGRGRIRRRVVFTKLVAASINLGSGASAGREGPIAHIGAALGAFVGRVLKLSDRERRLLLIAGAAGGIGAIFRTPLGGALFVVEVLYSDDLEADALVPAVLSSVVAYSLFTGIFGEGVLFATVPNYHLNWRELPLFVAMALCCGIVGVIFVQAHHRVSRLYLGSKVPRPVIALLAGLVVGLLSLVHPAALGAGYGWMQEALEPTGLIETGWRGAGTLLLIVVVKVVATAVSASSGAAGGVFGPSVVIGGMVGGAFGMAFHEIAPEVVVEPSSYMLVGMACFVGGVSRAPLSTLVMASEMTGSYELLVPTMLAEVITFALIRKAHLYEQQVPTRRDSPAHGGEYVLDVLQDLLVRDVFTPRSVTQVERSLPLSALLRQVSESDQMVFPVLGKDGRPEGMVTLDTIKAYHYDEDVGMLAIAADCETPFEYVRTHDTLAVALEKMATSHYSELPVLGSSSLRPTGADSEERDFSADIAAANSASASSDSADSASADSASAGKPAEVRGAATEEGSQILGLISYDDLLRAYSRELSRRRRGGEALPDDSA